MIMKRILYFLLALVIMASCSAPKDIAYFQDRQPGTSEQVTISAIPFKVRPGDRISIYVKSRKDELAQQFNLYGGASGSMNVGTNGNNSGYYVDDNGEIDFPVLGKLKLEGMDRQEITNFLTDTLRHSGLVDDAIVMVDYTGLYVTVLGQSGGRRVNITKDKMTLFELIAECGDLNIDAKRKNVLVIREEDGVRSQYEVDLTKMKNVYDSPVYYVHQNDIVYIEPNDKTKRGSTVNGNLFQTWGFWTGITGLFMSAYSLINLFK